MRAFLSHSSLDKDHYVVKVANKIGRDRVVYDDLTFEEGLPSIEEIDRGLNSSDLFVVFLSENSINSDWVKYELFKANLLLKDKAKLKKIYPIIIDSKIKYNDDRIPKWLQENNLRVVISPNKAASLILQRLRELSYKEHPKLEEKNKIFVGRNEIIEKFEMRINDFERNVPFAIFTSGLGNNIGRKKVMYHSLLKTDSINSSYRPPIIELSSHESIEDLILKIDDLGMTDNIARRGLLEKNLDEKVKIVASQLKQLKDENQRLFIEDNGCIVMHDRDLVDWFQKLYDDLKGINYIILGIATIYRIYESYTFSLDEIMFAHIPELNKEERSALFYRYLQFEEVNLVPSDIKLFANILSGYPDQAYYAVRLIKELGLPLAKKNANLIIEYNSERVVNLVNEYENNKKIMDFLALLTAYGTIGYNTFFDIVGANDENNTILEEFFAKGICETFGVNKEYIRLNDIIYDYLIRMGLKLPDEYNNKIVESLNEFIDKNADDDYMIDITKYIFLIKKAIIDNRINEVKDLLIPSHFLQSMKELYDVHKNYEDVITLADRILNNDNFVDEYIKKEIRYYLCLSLARTKNDRFKEEVRNIDGAEHDFLFGFYYRQIGKTDKAIERYEAALTKRRSFARAQRDLVQVYLSIEDYETAYKLAKENYEQDRKRNPYHIHAYFSSLLRISGIIDKNKILNKLIEELSVNKHEKAREFHLICKAQYEAFINNDELTSMQYINTAYKEFPTNHRVLIDKYYICAKFHNENEMEIIINDYKERFDIKQIFHNNTIIKFQILLHAIREEYEKIPKLLKYLRFYPEAAVRKLIEKYSNPESEIAVSSDET